MDENGRYLNFEEFQKDVERADKFKAYTNIQKNGTN